MVEQKKKLSLGDIQVESFITSMDSGNGQTIVGGTGWNYKCITAAALDAVASWVQMTQCFDVCMITSK